MIPWYVWLIVSIVIVAVILTVWLLLRNHTESSLEGSLPEPNFRTLTEVSLSDNLIMSHICFSTSISSGFLSTFNENSKIGNFFKFSFQTGDFVLGESIRDCQECVILESLCVVRKTDPELCDTYLFANNVWNIIETKSMAQIIPVRLWNNDGRLYCIGYWEKSVVVYQYETEIWTRFFTESFLSDIKSVDITTNGTIYVVDKKFVLSEILFQTTFWGVAMKIDTLWSSFDSDLIDANISVKTDGTLLSLSLARYDNLLRLTTNRYGTFNISQKQWVFENIIEPTNLVVSTTSLPDFKLLSFVEGVSLYVYRTSVENNYDVIANNPMEQRGDPAEFNNLNATVAQLMYYNDNRQILLISGGASENQTIIFSTMSS
jgi:hypothetical protein